MSKLFLHLLNISITAGWIVLIVTALRFVLKRAPKWIRVALWGLVALRLLLPVSVQSVLSLVPSAETVSVETVTYPASVQAAAPAPVQGERIVIETGFPALNSAVNPTAEQAAKQVDTVAVLKTVAGWVWLSGAAVMLLYALISYLRLRHRVRASVRLEKGAYLCDDIKSPFILGLFLPKIYLPSGTDGATKGYVLAHERAHLRRFDHVWKPLGFLLLSVYWFNPLLWLAYILLCRDIELACDEKVVKEYDDEHKAAYSEALVKSSVSRRSIAACPLAFGETGVKSRVKSILNYKKPAFWIILVALLAGIVTAVCFLTVPKKNKTGEAEAPKSVENMKVAYICTETGAFAETNINENIWTGLTAFAEAHSWTFNIQYSYEAPRDESDPEDIMKASERAIENGANVLIIAGYYSFEPVDTLAVKYPDIQFLMIDHEQDGYVPKSPNVYSITFNINEAGYLAGYAAVADGYRNLAYLGLEPYTQSEPFVKGVNAAAEKFGVSTDIQIINDYDAIFDKDKIAELYRTGTEVIYAPYDDWFAVCAASDTGGKVISVDHVNIGYDQGTNILCCTKRNVTSAVQMALDTLWNNGGKWPQDCAGAQQVLGLNNGGVGLYTEPEFWRFENFTSDAYYELLDSLLDYDVLESYNKKVDSAVVVTEWRDYYSASDQMPWDEKKRIGIDAINNVRFEWTSGSVEAIYDGATHTLFTGMPIWNVFIADITRDGKPELCATVSFGSGMVDDHIVVYDYANRQSYTLWDRGTFDYHLYTADGALYVGKTPYMGDKQVDYGTLMMHDGVLCCRWQSDSSFTSLNRELCASELYGEWIVEEETDNDGNVLYTHALDLWKEYHFQEDGTVTYNETVPISSDSELAFGHPIAYPFTVHDDHLYIDLENASDFFRWGQYDRETNTITLTYNTADRTVYAKLRRMGTEAPQAQATPEPSPSGGALRESDLYGGWLVQEETDGDGSVLFSFDRLELWKEYDFLPDGTVRCNESKPYASADYTNRVYYPYAVQDGSLRIENGLSTTGFVDPQTGNLILRYRSVAGKDVHATLTRWKGTPEAGRLVTQAQADAFVNGLSVEIADGSPYGCDLVVFLDGFGRCLNVGDRNAFAHASLRFEVLDKHADSIIYTKYLDVGGHEYNLGDFAVLAYEDRLYWNDQGWGTHERHSSEEASIFVTVSPSMVERNREVTERACVIKSFDAENRTVTVSFVSFAEAGKYQPAYILYDTVEEEELTLRVTDDTFLSVIDWYDMLVKLDRFFRYLEENRCYLNGVDDGTGDDRGIGFWIGLDGDTLLYLCEVYEE